MAIFQSPKYLAEYLDIWLEGVFWLCRRVTVAVPWRIQGNDIEVIRRKLRKRCQKSRGQR
ncbi:hypothetical protein GCM10007052_03110 [Halioglobus japonicus]|nr:hypothetical protein GCM10007052_03110 [Halioglobus japonicus]